MHDDLFDRIVQYSTLPRYCVLAGSTRQRARGETGVMLVDVRARVVGGLLLIGGRKRNTMQEITQQNCVVLYLL